MAQFDCRLGDARFDHLVRQTVGHLIERPVRVPRRGRRARPGKKAERRDVVPAPQDGLVLRRCWPTCSCWRRATLHRPPPLPARERGRPRSRGLPRLRGEQVRAGQQRPRPSSSCDLRQRWAFGHPAAMADLAEAGRHRTRIVAKALIRFAGCAQDRRGALVAAQPMRGMPDHADRSGGNLDPERDQPMAAPLRGALAPDTPCPPAADAVQRHDDGSPPDAWPPRFGRVFRRKTSAP